MKNVWKENVVVNRPALLWKNEKTIWDAHELKVDSVGINTIMTSYDNNL